MRGEGPARLGTRLVEVELSPRGALHQMHELFGEKAEGRVVAAGAAARGGAPGGAGAAAGGWRGRGRPRRRRGRAVATAAAGRASQRGGG